MLALPPVDPPLWWRFGTRLGRGDLYVRVDTCDYSVHPRHRPPGPGPHRHHTEVLVLLGEDIVARHARCRSRHQSITDPRHNGKTIWCAQTIGST